MVITKTLHKKLHLSYDINILVKPKEQQKMSTWNKKFMAAQFPKSPLTKWLQPLILL